MAKPKPSDIYLTSLEDNVGGFGACAKKRAANAALLRALGDRARRRSTLGDELKAGAKASARGLGDALGAALKGLGDAVRCAAKPIADATTQPVYLLARPRSRGCTTCGGAKKNGSGANDEDENANANNNQNIINIILPSGYGAPAMPGGIQQNVVPNGTPAQKNAPNVDARGRAPAFGQGGAPFGTNYGDRNTTSGALPSFYDEQQSGAVTREIIREPFVVEVPKEKEIVKYRTKIESVPKEKIVPKYRTKIETVPELVEKVKWWKAKQKEYVDVNRPTMDVVFDKQGVQRPTMDTAFDNQSVQRPSTTRIISLFPWRTNK